MNRKIIQRGRQSGNIGIIFALIALPVVTSIGVGVDMGRAHLVKNRLAFALDAAVLAAGSSIGSEQDLQERLEHFVHANFDDDDLGRLIHVQMQQDGNRITATAKAELDTSFMRIVGKSVMEVSASNEVLREVKGVEVALVLDVTGSMLTNDNIGALRQATHIFLDVLYGDRSYDERIRVGMVPYSAAVNAGAVSTQIVSNPENIPYSETDPFAWRGCVRERAYPHDVIDSSTAAGGLWQIYRYPAGVDNQYTMPGEGRGRNRHGSVNDDVHACNEMTGPNLGCPAPITPLTGSADTLRQATNALEAWCRGGTMGNIGMAWGVRVLSPYSPFPQGSDFDDPLWRKVIVMMTDGENQFWRYNVSGSSFGSDYTGYGRVEEGAVGTTNRSSATQKLNERLDESCAHAKELGIRIYTITFGNLNSTTRSLYERCASKPDMYFNAPSQQDLRNSFAKIAEELANLRLTQ